eukprot:35636_1
MSAAADLHPVLLGLIGTSFTWGVTAAGAALVLTTDAVSPGIMEFAFGGAAGVMVSASCFGLLLPALDIAESQFGKVWSWAPPSIGFALAFVFFQFFERWLEQRQKASSFTEDILTSTSLGSRTSPSGGLSSMESGVRRRKKSPRTSSDEERFGFRAAHETSGAEKTRRMILLITAITVHNFPEGMAVGVAFGAASNCRHSPHLDMCNRASFGSAVALTVGIAIQNFPEGMAVALPLRKDGMNRWRSFWYGQLSGAVEPIGAILGASATLVVRGLLPYALGFAAGAMLYVVISELLPETYSGSTNPSRVTYGFMTGFLVMMTLDVVLA